MLLGDEPSDLSLTRHVVQMQDALRSELVDLRIELMNKIGALELKMETRSSRPKPRPCPACPDSHIAMLAQLTAELSGLRTELLDKISLLGLKMEPRTNRPYYGAAWGGSAHTTETQTTETGPSVMGRASAFQDTQAADSMRVRMQGSSVFRSLRNVFGTKCKCSFEDVESLVSNLILFDTFLFAFSATLMTGTFSHDDLLEQDTRDWMLRPGCYQSHDFLWFATTTELILVCSLLLGLTLGLSLGFSNCRENERSFERWLVFGRPLTCFAYLLFVLGFGYFFMTSALAADLIYPRYPISPAVGVKTCFPEVEFPLRFDTSTNTLITLQNINDTSDGKYLREWWYPLDSTGRRKGHTFGLAWAFALRSYYTMAALLIGISIVGVFGIVAFNFVDARKIAAECSGASGS
jgi:hypothetical protein